MSSNEIIKERAKNSKNAMIVYLRYFPALIIIASVWTLVTGKAQSVNGETAAWIAIAASIIGILIEIYTYLTLPDKNAFNIPPGNVRFRFMLRSIEVVAIYFVSMTALALLLDGILGWEKMVPAPYKWFGIIFIVIGFGISRWTMSTYINKGQGTTVPYEPTQKLIIEGPFRYVRNPMILSSELMVLGMSIVLSSYMLLLLLLMIIIGDHLYVVKVEEKELEVRFGQSYIDYKARVHRWIPRKPGRTNSSVA